MVRGTPQGAVISPLLANVYLHHVLDGWFARQWRPREARGEVYIVRYADDFVLGFEYRSDAERAHGPAMRDRLGECSELECTRRRRACWILGRCNGELKNVREATAGQGKRSTSSASRTPAGGDLDA